MKLGNLIFVNQCLICFQWNIFLFILLLNSCMYTIFRPSKNTLICPLMKYYNYHMMWILANFWNPRSVLTLGTAFFSNRRFMKSPLSREPNFILTKTFRFQIENCTLINLHVPFGGLFPTVLELFPENTKMWLRKRPILARPLIENSYFWRSFHRV